MTLLYCGSIFQQHDTGQHPENAQRLRSIKQKLSSSDVLARCRQPEWEPATIDQLTLVHRAELIESVSDFADSGGGRIEADTIVSPRSFEVAKSAAGAACNAVKRVIAGEDDSALCLIRPPGHHALPGQPMGFCLLNNVAVAAKYAISQLDCNQVMIVDWDVHHGNGTQAIFWSDPQVGFVSMHRYPFYPGSGNHDETGSGDGLGTTLNVPIRFGTSRREQLDAFRVAVESIAEKIKPELILISAGFDSHAQDPIGSLGLESEDFTELTTIVQNVAQTHASGRIVSLLEGGYNPDALAESVDCHLQQLMTDI
ncbi:MAG: histone deacetylase [Pirellulaceae bacterium]|nr:histone deacetylase [Pirellulaceae bacterium]